MSADRTIDVIGERKISVCKNYASKLRFSYVLAISASGAIQKPFVIVKGV